MFTLQSTKIGFVVLCLYALWHLSLHKPCDINIYNIETEHGFNYLLQRKTHDIALIIGTGKTANLITRDNAYRINMVADIWGMNQVFFHPYIVPKFYHLEMRSGNYGSNRELWSYFDQSKRQYYTNTTFLTTTSDKNNIADMLTNKYPIPDGIVTYRSKMMLNNREGCTESNLKYIYMSDMFNLNGPITEFCAASLTRIINIILRMKYNNIAFIGVDLNSAVHFYSNHPFILGKRGKYERNVLNLDSKKYNSSIHATGARGIQLFLNKLAFLSINMSYYNLGHTSLLTKIEKY
ncbi:hypothetical protein ENVG_00061 [Emiliania huxleyi virus 84]|nr:hypothetical protein ENVG_00061 [Emiliania huxleyi virus 84]